LFNSIQIKEYRENKGKVCPYCGKSSVTTLRKKEGLKIINQDRATQKMECKSCKKIWIEIYPIFDIEEIEEDNDEKTTDR